MEVQSRGMAMNVLSIAPWALVLALCGPIYAQVDVTIESDGTTRYASDLDVDGEHEVPTSTTLPATCNTGDVQVDTDEADGGQWFLCTATNTWVGQGGVLRTHATDCTSITDDVDGEVSD